MRYPEGPLPLEGGDVLVAEYSEDRVLRLLHDGSVVVELNLPPSSGPCGLALRGPWPLPCSELLVACYDSGQVLAFPLLSDGRRFGSTCRSRHEVPRANDMAVDEFGGVFVTSSGEFDLAAPATGAVYYLPPLIASAASGSARACVRLDVPRSIRYANGIVCSRDSLYVAEHLHNRVLRYRIVRGQHQHRVLGGQRDDRIALEDERVFADLPPHPNDDGDAGGLGAYVGPDGMCLDARRGLLYVAQFGAGRVLAIPLLVEGRNPEIAVLFSFPRRHVTNVALSPDGSSLHATCAGDPPEGPDGACEELALVDASGTRAQLREPWVRQEHTTT